MPKELWMDVGDIVQETVIKTIPKTKKCKKANCFVCGCLTNSYEYKWKRSRKQRRKGKIYPLECRIPKNSKER